MYKKGGGIMNHDLSVWVELFRDVGFPVLLAVYLLLRFEKRIHKLTKTIDELKENNKKE